jgi:uncharacterized protein YfbU (UPF0304 family)
MIVIPILELKEVSEYKQIQKIKEECTEIQMAEIQKESLERKLEESFDAIEATVNYMHKIATGVEIEQAGAKHFMKMRDRGYNIIGLWEVTRV